MSLYSEEVVVGGPFCIIGVKTGSLFSGLVRAILQCEYQAVAPLCHHTAKCIQDVTWTGLMPAECEPTRNRRLWPNFRERLGVARAELMLNH